MNLRAALTLVLLLAAGPAVRAAETGSGLARDQARQILADAGVKGGLIVHLGCGDGKLTAALRANDSTLVHGLDANGANIEKARAHIRSLGLHGKVSVEQWAGGRLPYADNLVNLLVAEGLGQVPAAEVTRVLVPRGVAYVGRGGKWSKTVKPWPSNIDEWSHYLHDATGNGVASDTVVGPPKHMQWVARPLHARSHEIDTSVCAVVSARGRLFYILDEGLTGITDERLPEKWAVVARDAFNGVLLWKRPLPDWGWPQWKRSALAGKDWTKLRGQRTRSPLTLPRRLVADGDRVYVTLGFRAPISVLDAATGKTLHTWKGTELTDEILCSRGTVVARIRTAAADTGKLRTGKALPETLAALRGDTGDVLWKKPVPRILPLCLAVDGDRVVFQSGNDIVCLELSTGEQAWRTRLQRPKTQPKPTGKGRRRRRGGSGTLVARGGVVLVLALGQIHALSATNGQLLWTGPGGRGPGVANPPDLFVADGLVWHGSDRKGRDPRTGKVKRTLDIKRLITQGHHFRCYRSKATERYLLWPKRGVEFLDLKGSNHMRHDWLRAPCKYGVVPCNGLLYVPSNQCFCYPGVNLHGFLALAAGVQAAAAPAGPRFRRGPAYGGIANRKSQIANASDWPTYRHDPKRSGSAATAAPAKLDRLWQAKLGGRITQPVVAGGKLFIASVDEHRLHCLDAASGKPLWDYTVGGRIDSPPTIHQSLVLCGSADGHVYCLRASDGKLVWRFRAAPEDRRVVALGQLESAWPVPGSVLVKDGVAYVAAGRSSYLDGGIFLYGLDPQSGKVLHRGRLDGPHPDITKDPGRPFDMDGTFADVLVTDGKFLYMQQITLDATLADRTTPRATNMGDRKVGRHIFSTAGFLNDAAWNRTFWMYSERWPGFYIANQAPKAGQLLVFDDTTTYGVKQYTRRNCHSPMFFPGKDGYLLFADDNETEPLLVDKDTKVKPVKWLRYREYPSSRGPTRIQAVAANRDKGVGFTRPKPPKWAAWIRLRVRAMVVAGDTLFIAGPPDVLDPKDPYAAFEARAGAALWAVSASDGKTLAEVKLDSPPVFDGLIAANARLYLSTRDGRLTCLGAK